MRSTLCAIRSISAHEYQILAEKKSSRVPFICGMDNTTFFLSVRTGYNATYVPLIFLQNDVCRLTTK